MTEMIVVAVITGVLSLVGTLSGSYFANRKSTALITYRIDQLEAKVHKHNNLIEKTYKLEERCQFFDEKLKVVNHRIGDLERS